MTLLSILIVWALLKYTPVRSYFSRIHYTLPSSGLTIVVLLVALILLHGLRVHFPPLYNLLGIILLLYAWSYQEKDEVIPGTLHDQVRFVFSHALHDSFAVILWFVLLGPFGIILYDVVRRHQKTGQNSLDWLPARVLAFGFALAGHFSAAFRYWLSDLKNSDSTEFLEESGLLALGGDSDLPQAEALVKRAQIMLLVVLALVALGHLL